MEFRDVWDWQPWAIPQTSWTWCGWLGILTEQTKRSLAMIDGWLQKYIEHSMQIWYKVLLLKDGLLLFGASSYSFRAFHSCGTLYHLDWNLVLEFNFAACRSAQSKTGGMAGRGNLWEWLNVPWPHKLVHALHRERRFYIMGATVRHTDF